MAQDLRSAITHIFILLVLVIVLLATLIFTGVVGCDIIPSGCLAYYQVLRGGEPKILIVHSGSGLGDAEALAQTLTDPSILRSRVSIRDIDRISSGTINDFDLVIVEEARRICSDKLRVFMKYVNRGGRLVWTGDAGAQLCEGDNYLLESERIEGGEKRTLGPWARRDGEKQLSFDEFLGVSYEANYCELARCVDGQVVGFIEPTDNSHRLTRGLSPSIPFAGDFAVVGFDRSAFGSRLVATIDNGTNLIGEATGKPWLEGGQRHDFGRHLPFIVSSGLGGRVAYYAAPLEQFVASDDQKYKALIEQMYAGMLFG